MPAIPTYESNMAAQANKRIIEQPTFAPDNSMGNALLKVADVGTEIALRVEKANTDREVITANRLAQEQIEKAKFDLEQDQTIADDQIQPTLRKTAETILSKTAEGISSARAREMWSEQAKGSLLLEGDDWARKQQLRRGADRARGSHVAAISSLDAKAGDLTLPAETFGKFIQDERSSITRNMERGVIDREQAARLNADLDNLARKDFTIRWSSNIDEDVKNGNIAEAKAKLAAGAGKVDGETWSKMKTGLDASEKDFEVVSKGDQYWEQAKGDYGAYLKLTAKEKDPDLRLKLEQRGGQKLQQSKAAEDARQDGLQERMWAHVQGGGTIMNAPPSLRASIDPNRLSSIRAFESARDEEKGLTGPALAVKKLQSASISNILQSRDAMPPEVFMNDPGTWSPRNFAMYQAMTPDDQIKMDEARRKMRDGGGTYETQNKVEGQLLDLAKTVAPKSWGLTKDADQRTPETERLLGELRGEAVRLMKENGNADLTPDQLKQSIAKALKRAGESVDNPFVYWNLYSANMDPRSQMSGGFTMEYQKLYNELKAASGGIEPDLADVEALRKARSAGKQ